MRNLLSEKKNSFAVRFFLPFQQFIMDFSFKTQYPPQNRNFYLSHYIQNRKIYIAIKPQNRKM